MADLDHIYDMLKDQNEVMRKQAETLSAIAQSQSDSRERLSLALGYFKDELSKTNLVVERHTNQITFWRGALAVIGVLWTAALAWGGVVISKHR